MIEKLKRPLQDKEKRALTSSIGALNRRWNLLYTLTFLSAFVVVTILWKITVRVATGHWQAIAFYWLYIGTIITAWYILTEHRRIQRRKDTIEEALHRDEAEVIHIKTSEMYEFAEVEDEGATYAFQVEEDSIIFIVGPEFYPSAKFPNNDFELIYIYGRDGKLAKMLIEKHGEKLKPVCRLSALTKKDLNLPDHLGMVNGRLEDLEQILRVKHWK